MNAGNNLFVNQAIRLDHLPLGIYLLKAYDDQGNQIDQKKLIKIRQQWSL